jgi:hypothetical protein
MRRLDSPLDKKGNFAIVGRSMYSKGSGMKREYETPELREVGSLIELTQSFNKHGHKADQFTAVTNGEIVGSLYPV